MANIVNLSVKKSGSDFVKSGSTLSGDASLELLANENTGRNTKTAQLRIQESSSASPKVVNVEQYGQNIHNGAEGTQSNPESEYVNVNLTAMANAKMVSIYALKLSKDGTKSARIVDLKKTLYAEGYFCDNGNYSTEYKSEKSKEAQLGTNGTSIYIKPEGGSQSTVTGTCDDITGLTTFDFSKEDPGATAQYTLTIPIRAPRNTAALPCEYHYCMEYKNASNETPVVKYIKLTITENGAFLVVYEGGDHTKVATTIHLNADGTTTNEGGIFVDSNSSWTITF